MDGQHPRGRGIAGLESRAAGVPVGELIGVAQLELPAADAVHPYGRIVLDKVMLYKLAGHERDIVGGGEVRAVIKQSAAIGKVRVLKPKLCLLYTSRCV